VTEKKTTLSVPGAYLPLLEDIRLLKSDEQNPNRTTVKQREQIWRSLSKYGWTYPLIVDKDGVFADGEQRAEVLREHGEFFAPVLRLAVSDVDRRMLRQILNKLKGTHNRELDAAEFKRIAELGARFPKAGDGLPRLFISSRCINLISELLEYKVDVKERDHAVDALRYALKLQVAAPLHAFRFG
jgi:hypothetical protein